jgi:hypothetical protein
MSVAAVKKMRSDLELLTIVVPSREKEVRKLSNELPPAIAGGPDALNRTGLQPNWAKARILVQSSNLRLKLEAIENLYLRS